MRNGEAEGKQLVVPTQALVKSEWPLSPSPRQELGPLPHEDSNLMLHLQRLETTLSVCAEEPDHSQLFTHLGRMALEFNRLASKVHKNEQRTSILQVRPAREGHLGWAGVPPPPPPLALLGTQGTLETPRGDSVG